MALRVFRINRAVTGVAIAIALCVASNAHASAARTSAGGPAVRSGKLEAMQLEDFTRDHSHARLTYRLRLAGGERLQLRESAGRASATVEVTDRLRKLAGSAVTVRGALSGRRFTVADVQRSGGIAAKTAVAPGPRKVAVILFNFHDDTSQPYTIAQARGIVFGDPDSANAYYKEISTNTVSLQGKTNVSGDVFGWYTIANDKTPCLQGTTWEEAAKEKAEADGKDLSGYDHIIYVWPATEDVNCRGYGYLNEGRIGLDEWYFFASNVSHEIGHNFGLLHANSYECTGPSGERVTLSKACTSVEYGDWFDVMGYGYGRHMNGWEKTDLNFLPAANTQTVSTGGIYQLSPSETSLPAGTPQVLRIPRQTSFSDPNHYYYLEYRRPFGTHFDNFDPTDPVVTGVTVRIGPEYEPWGQTLLLDMAPATPDFLDAPLQPGQTFKDPTEGFSIKTVATSSSAATVELSYPGSQPPTKPAPPSSQTAVALVGDREAPLVRILRRRLKVGRKGSTFVEIGCPRAETGGCNGTASLETAAAKSSRSASQSRVLGRRSFAAPAGATAIVRIKLGRRARRLVSGRRHLAASLRVIARDQSGNSKTTVTSVKLTSAKHKHRR